MALSVHIEKGGNRKKLIFRWKRITAEYLSVLLVKVGQGILIASVLLLPVLYSSSLSWSGEYPKYIALLIISVLIGTLFLISILQSPKPSFIQSPILSIIILFLLCYIISAIFSIHPIASIFGNRGTWIMSVIGITGACVIAISSCSLFRVRNHAYRVLMYLTISGFFTAILYLGSVFLIPLFGFDKDLSVFLPIPTMVDLSAYLIITTAATTVIFLDPLTKHIRILTGIVIATQVAAILKAHTSLPATIGLAAIVLLGIAIFSSRRSLKNTAFAALGGLIIVFTVFGSPSFKSMLPDVVTEGSYYTDLKTTVSSWEPGISIFVDHPITGTGPELLNVELLSQSKSFTNSLISNSLTPFQFSNTYVTLLATTGLVGTIPLLLLTFFLLFVAIKERGKTSYVSKGYLFLGLVFLTTLLVVPLTALTAFAGFLVLGIGAAHITNTKDIERKHTPTSPLHYILVVSLAGYLLYSIFLYSRSEYLYMDSVSKPSPDNLDEVTEAINNYEYDPAYHRARTGYLVQYLRQHPDASNSSDIVKQIRQSVETALILNPYDYLNLFIAGQAYNDLSTLYSDSSYPLISLSYVSSAIERSPYDFRLFYYRGTVLKNMNNPTAALKDFKATIEIQKKYWPAYLSIANVYIQEENYEQASAYLQTVLEESQNYQITQAAISLLNSIPVTSESK